MAQDFAKQRLPEPGNAQRRKNQRSATRAPQSNAAPWSWFFTGMLTGLFLAFIGYLAVAQLSPAGPQGPVSTAGTEPAADSAGSSGNNGPDFDFYDYLPQAEVLVDVVPVEVGSEPAANNSQYLLQAGSFSSRADADNRRANIALLDFEARVVPGNVSGKTWHRVQVGPFTGRNNAQEAREKLAANDIDTIVLQMKQ